MRQLGTDQRFLRSKLESGSSEIPPVQDPPQRSSIQLLTRPAQITASSDAIQNLCLALGLAAQLARDIRCPTSDIENALQAFLAAIGLSQKYWPVGTPDDERQTAAQVMDGCKRSMSDSPLSAREQEILELISRGLSNKQIAKTLNIGPETVKSHINRVFIKLDVEKRAQAVALAQDLGMIRPSVDRRQANLIIR
jgi:DNA-binding CsgD family transcriptional regulator